MPEVLFIAVLILVVVVGILSNRFAEARRQQRMGEFIALGQNLGLESYPGGLAETSHDGFLEMLFGTGEGTAEDRFLQWFEGLHPFGVGHSKNVKNLLAGSKGGADWYVFDYEYKVTTSNGKTTSTTTYNNGIVAARLPLVLPGIRIGEEGFLSRIGNALGIRDIQFESEEFNRRYRVVCSDQKAAFDIIHPKMIEYLLASVPREWQMGGFWILIAEQGEPTIMEYRRVLEDMSGFISLIPGYVAQDRGFKPNWTGALDGIVDTGART